MKIVIVSGGSSGIGKACIQRFIKEDYYIYNFDIVSNQELKKYENYKYLKTDVSNQNSISTSVKEVIREQNKIDIIMASAGKHLSANIENTSQEQLMELITINMLGVYWLLQAVAPYMKERKFGRIITIGSDQSSVAKKNSVVYGMTKAAVLSLTKSMALDYADYNVRVNCIGAGTIDTPLYRNAIKNYAEKSGIPIDEIEADEAKEQPVNRIGRPEEVAELAFFLAQNFTDFLTGALLPIDGGYVAK